MSSPLRLLWLKTGPLHPLDTGGKIRTYHMLRELCRGHRVTYLSLCPASAGDAIRRDAREYSHEAVWIPWEETSKTSGRFYVDLLRNFAFSRRPYSIDKYESAAMAAKIQELEALKKFDLIVCDLGPSLGALNRAALVAADFVVIPMGPDLFSLYGLRNLGPVLKSWRKQWKARHRNFKENHSGSKFDLPSGEMQPLGYIVNRHSVLRKEPVKAFRNWIGRIPNAYREFVREECPVADLDARNDPHCLAQLKDYRSLAAMAQEHHKPMFSLTVADGAIGAHQAAVRQCREDFEGLALEILRRTPLEQ